MTLVEAVPEHEDHDGGQARDNHAARDRAHAEVDDPDEPEQWPHVRRPAATQPTEVHLQRDEHEELCKDDCPRPGHRAAAGTGAGAGTGPAPSRQAGTTAYAGASGGRWIL